MFLAGRQVSALRTKLPVRVDLPNSLTHCSFGLKTLARTTRPTVVRRVTLGYPPTILFPKFLKTTWLGQAITLAKIGNPFEKLWYRERIRRLDETCI